MKKVEGKDGREMPPSIETGLALKTHAAHFLKFVEGQAEKLPAEIDLVALQNDIKNIQTIAENMKATKEELNDTEVEDEGNKTEETTQNVIAYDASTIALWQEYWLDVKKHTALIWKYLESKDNRDFNQFLSTNPSFDLNSRQNDSKPNWSILDMACILGWKESVQKLLELGCDPNSTSNHEGRNSLHHTSFYGRSDCMESLLENQTHDYHTYLNAQDAQGNTSLHLAARNNHPIIVKQLLQAGAQPLSILNCKSLSAYDECVTAECLAVFNSYINLDGFSKYIFNGVVKGGRAHAISRLISQCPKLKKQRICLVSSQMATEQDLLNKTNFSLVRQLGNGGFAEVNLVQSNQDNKFYAMKVMRKDLIRQRYAEKYVLRERETLEKMLGVQFLCQMHFAFQDANFLYLGLEYIEGEDLSKLLFREDRLKEPQAKKYIAELVLAIESLHKHGIIYRDLKPENVLIDKQGHIKLIDFGLVATQVTHRFKATSFCGTPAYLAPEMTEHKPHCFSLDWYGVGILTYELLTGCNPFEGKNMEQILQNVLTKRISKPSYVSFDAWDFITALMCKDPQSRLGYVSGEQVKAHKWMKGIDWTEVAERKQQMPQYDWMKDRGQDSKGKKCRAQERHQKKAKQDDFFESFEEIEIDRSDDADQQNREPSFTSQNLAPFYYNWTFL